MIKENHTPIDWSMSYIFQSSPLTPPAQPIWLISVMTTMEHIPKPNVVVLILVGILENTLGPEHKVPIVWLRYQ